MKKAPNDVDRHVGSRVRMRRLLNGLSQEKLADGLGITFQQVQKYEKGVNRISASRLSQIADILVVTIDYFYDGMNPADTDGQGRTGFSEAPSPGYDADIFTSEGLKLLRAFREIKDPQVRRRLLDLASALSTRRDPGPGGSTVRSE